MKHYPIYIGGEEVRTQQSKEVKAVYSGHILGKISLALDQDIDQALEIGSKATKVMRSLTAYEKRKILLECKQLFEERFEEFAVTITQESGKTINESRAEMQRVISTFDYASIEVMQMDGNMLAMDTHPSSENFECLIKRYPKGLCTFITPFNFPVNLIAHKVAPAIAAGCPFIIKPSDKTPLCALMFAEVLKKSSLPKEAFSVLPCSNEDSLKLVKDDRVKFLSFTGSEKIGWMLKKLAGKKSVCLELGGVASCIVYPDTNLEIASKEIISAAFSQAGQSCISLQKLYIHKDISNNLIQLIKREAEKIVMGDPLSPETKLGPMISNNSLSYIEDLVNKSLTRGSKIITGGKRVNNFYQATIMRNVQNDDPLYANEVFAPLFIIEEFSDTDQVFEKINTSPYGIHVGIYSKDIQLAMKAWDKLECTGIIYGHVPTWRSDKMPYGGIKNSGCGREGIRYAIEEMSELKSLLIKK
ncbi:aldehyde dehydrogenase family protein [Lentisphaera marina]|uniref:aldehyde dehydrogenase family protein n=1 Tax=Lentisphaera marina TaxID=1111041 RepID=UPI002366DF4B|nr:aldehyde dehydrogenase family protein [Lentisphaera marina]MDD7983601.1 aldehyde dehydrogenase family protein [Lentisphaera marina]